MNTDADPRTQRITKLAAVTVLFTVATIAFGAFVRATKSGAGCGGHWPTCDGAVVPLLRSTAMAIELTHRVSSGLCLLMIITLGALVLRSLPNGHPARRTAIAAALFGVLEALFGAILVLFGLVAHDQSVARAIAMPLHLVNTFLLLGALTLTALFTRESILIKMRGQGAVAAGLAVAMVGVVALGATGAVAALGDTLFPTGGLGAALKDDLSASSHFLLRLRLLHPLIAISCGLYLLAIAGFVAGARRDDAVQRLARTLSALVIAQLGAGFVNVVFMAPVALQLVHLVLADALWIVLVLFSARALSVQSTAHDSPRETEAPGQPAAPSPLRDIVRAYVALTKPRVVSLLLFTTVAAMFIAQNGAPPVGLVLLVCAGGYMAAGAANAINMVLDRDIDAKMHRTVRRPTVTRELSTTAVLAFAAALSAGSFGVLALAANLLTAALAAAGLLYYVVIYTIGVKRRTWQNIVIGGAAGAFPPLVGWAAVTGELNALAWVLFAIIFVWTPVHFWALALLIKDDYAAARVPMLPVVRGERATVIQISGYAALTAVVSTLPVLHGHVSSAYLVASLCLNGLLLLNTARLAASPDRPRALSLFKFSMAYLALLFLALAIDRSLYGTVLLAAARATGQAG